MAMADSWHSSSSNSILIILWPSISESSSQSANNNLLPTFTSQDGKISSTRLGHLLFEMGTTKEEATALLWRTKKKKKNKKKRRSYRKGNPWKQVSLPLILLSFLAPLILSPVISAFLQSTSPNSTLSDSGLLLLKRKMIRRWLSLIKGSPLCYSAVSHLWLMHVARLINQFPLSQFV